MIKKENFAKAYKEIFVIIGHLSDEDRNKIPKEFVDMIETKMDKDYVFNYDLTKDLTDQHVLRETMSILAYIYINYIGEYNDVKEIKIQFQKDIIEHEKIKKAIYEKNNPNDSISNLRKANNSVNSNISNQSSSGKVNQKEFEKEVSLIDSKQDKWYSKIVSFFKNMFK
jgi:hypothetical protein